MDALAALVRWASRLFVYLAASLLPIWVAFELSLHVARNWGLFPISGYAEVFDPPAGPPGGLIQWAYHLILPGFVLGLPVAAIYARVLRALARDVRLAGASAPPSERAEAVGRARTTAAVVLLKGLLRDVGFLMGAALFVENVFDLPGLGREIVVAATNGDGPMVEGILIIGTLVPVVVALAGNLVGGAASRAWRLGS